MRIDWCDRIMLGSCCDNVMQGSVRVEYEY